MAEPGVFTIPQRRTLRVPSFLRGDDLVYGLIHVVTPYRTEWQSLCGFDFLSYQTTLEDRVVTCVWCAIGALRRWRLGDR